jgi:hypothetical protein
LKRIIVTTVIAFGAFAGVGTLITRLDVGPTKVHAQTLSRACTIEDARGNYGMQFFGSISSGQGLPFVPFAETGILNVVNTAGDITGTGRYSFGGFLVTHTFKGSVTVDANCMAKSTITDINPDGSLGAPLTAVWVILKPGEEIMMTSEATGGAVNGVLKRIDRR